ncbi:MAG: CapA family protein [Pseudomonadota bacterium]
MHLTTARRPHKPQRKATPLAMIVAAITACAALAADAASTSVDAIDAIKTADDALPEDRAVTPTSPDAGSAGKAANAKNEPAIDPAIEPGSASRRTHPSPDDELIVIVLVGDTGLNASRKRVDPKHALRHGRRLPWATTTRDVDDLIDGDINFANIETVITARNSLRPSGKTFTFRMHPNGARHLVDIGFNVFSMANNHSADYGVASVRDSLAHLKELRATGLRAHAGIGYDEDGAMRPATFALDTSRFAFSAMGIGASSPGAARAGPKKPGQINIHDPRKYAETVERLADADADYRILSMHFGMERNVRPLGGQVRRWRDETQYAHDIDLIVGHHAHVVQGVQENRGGLIFYGLGNFLHMGMQDMAKFNACRDYGLLARVFATRGKDGRIVNRAVQVHPLTAMHERARPLRGKRARARLDILNFLAAELDDPKKQSRGVRFAPQADGSGLYCTPGAEHGPGRLGKLCRDHRPPPALTKRIRSRIAGQCRFRPKTATRTATRRPASSRGTRKRTRIWRGGNVFNRR